MYIYSRTVYFRRNKMDEGEKGKHLGYSWILYNGMRTEILSFPNIGQSFHKVFIGEGDAENSAPFQGIKWENNLLSILLENVSCEWVWKERSHNIESSVYIHWDVYYWIHLICRGQPWQCFLFFIWFVSWESTQDSGTPLLLAFIQRPSNTHLCCLPLTK